MPSYVSPKYMSRSVSNTVSNSFNPWVIIITAFIFFSVLALFTFVFSAFGHFCRHEDDKDRDDERVVLITFIFFLVWVMFGFILYIYVDRNNLLKQKINYYDF